MAYIMPMIGMMFLCLVLVWIASCLLSIFVEIVLILPINSALSILKRVGGGCLIVASLFMGVNAIFEIPQTYAVGIRNEGYSVLFRPILDFGLFTITGLIIGICTFLKKWWIDYLAILYTWFLMSMAMSVSYIPTAFHMVALCLFLCLLVALGLKRHAVRPSSSTV